MGFTRIFITSCITPNTLILNRSVALSFPELWSNVDICLDARLKWHQVSVSADYRWRRLASGMGLLNLQLHHAGSYKLSVTVHGDYFMDRDALSCINLIHTRVRRWWSLNLLSADLCPRYVHGLIGSTPSFDSLEVLSVGHTLLEHFYKLGETEPTMPLLRTFYAQLNEADINFRPSLKMARHLGAWSTNVETIICENALCWFPLFKNARNLIIIAAMKRKGDNAEPMPCLSQMPGVHQIGNITSLTFDINVDTHDICWFGERFRFPNFLHLKILYHKNGTYGPVGDAAELVCMRYPLCASFIENLLPYLHSLSIKSLCE